MSKIHSAHFEEIFIGDGRQRKEFDTKDLMELSTSITKVGLIHPVVLRRREEDEKLVLVAGERRIRAMHYVWLAGTGVKCAGDVYPLHQVPFTFVGDITPLEAYRVELEENIARKELRWQDRSEATLKLLDLEKAEAEAAGAPIPTLEVFAKEKAESGVIPNSRPTIRQDVILASNMHIPEVAAASTPKEAMKALQKHEAQVKAVALAVSVGETFNSSMHTLITGSCLEHLPKVADGTFDVVLSDPPYGMGADDFDDGGGAQETGDHGYQDDYDFWRPLMEGYAQEIARVAKPAAHLYLFCDFARFQEIQAFFSWYGEWKVHRTPLIWHNPNANRIPWPEHGPMRKYQCIVYAYRGGKKTQKIAPDILVYPTDPNLGHNAQKPVALFQDLLSRSCLPGDKVLDGFCGTGTIFPAAHALKVAATGIELEQAYAGLAAKRLEELK